MIAHVFIDAENVPPAVTFKVVEHFGKEHTITKVDIIAKEDTLPYKYRNLDEKLYRIQNCFYGKNSADTWLCFEMVRAIIDEPDLELIIIVSSDKDFLPAIKFAVDFEKKILIVSNGAGHRKLIEHMKILDINPAAVELRDFRLKFGNFPQKLEKFLPQFSFETKKFFFDREDRIKFILVKKGESIFEVPFVEGMETSTFGRILRELNILERKFPVRNFITENFLKLSRNRIYFQSETELSTPTTAELIENYFSKHAEETIKIFIKHNGRLLEISFVNGMPLDIFGKLLQEKKIIGKSASPAQAAANSLLKVDDGKVYLRDEDEQATAYEGTIKNVDEYLDFHASEIKKILIKHGQKISEVPFVNGISLELFGKLLREKNIIGKSTSATSIAKKNFLDIRDGKIYLCDEERLSELYAESTGDIDSYFEYRGDDTKKIFVNYNGKLFEIPFVDGMPLTLFGKVLRDRKIIGKNSSAIKVAANSLLDVRDERVYLIAEEELDAAQDDLETDVDKYFNAHVFRIRTISIRHAVKDFSIPFVDGMPIKVFGKLLRERKIIDRKTPLEEIVKNNDLILIDEKVFLK
ncbi:MAG: NYN domain-containing protein [Selenomonadaceae bacterium]|nr:NYN domain-containing protein [Selenomonadaceae bacterium]